MKVEEYRHLLKAAEICADFNDLPKDEILDCMQSHAEVQGFVEKDLELADTLAGNLPLRLLIDFAAGDYADDDQEMFKKIANYWDDSRAYNVLNELLNAGF